MFSKTWTQPSTAVSSDPIEQLKGALASADAVVVGAGAGLSASAGMTYSGERFRRYFSDFQSRYDIQDKCQIEKRIAQAQYNKEGRIN